MKNSLAFLVVSILFLGGCATDPPTAPDLGALRAGPARAGSLTGAPTVTLTASATLVPPNTPDTIKYVTSGASSPCMSNWGGTKPATGQEIFVVPAPGYTFTLSCTNAAGTTTASVTVAVGPAATICVTITGLPTGTPGAVKLTGPQFAANIYAGKNCFTVVPATYSLAASSVTASNGSIFAPTPASVTFITLDGSQMSVTVAYAAQANTGPQITGIAGVTNADAGITNGLADMPCGTLYNGYRVINNATGVYPWTLSGQNFGSAPGTVLLGGRAVKILSWQSNAITIDPTLPWAATPSQMSLDVRTATGQLTPSQSIQVAPAISSRIYGQCTYHVALRRFQMGLVPSPYAYSGYATITSTYVPRRGDQYKWAAPHTAIIEAVSGPVTNNGTSTYTITIGEQNADCRNGIDQFVTTFAVKGKIVTAYPTHPKLGITTAYYR